MKRAVTGRLVGGAGAVLIHALLALLFIDLPPAGSNVGRKASDAQAFIHVRLIPKSASKDVQPLPRAGDRAGATSRAAEERICRDKDESYQGIGIIYAPLSMVILSAPESYPAYRAGLREGDIILTSQGPDQNGYVTYLVLRNNEQLTFRIKQEKICFEENAPPAGST